MFNHVAEQVVVPKHLARVFPSISTEIDAMPLASLAETLIEMLLITLTVAPSPGAIVTMGAGAAAATVMLLDWAEVLPAAS